MESRLSGVPLGSAFFVKAMFIVKKKGSGVEVEISGGVEFVEDTIWKAVIGAIAKM